MKIQLTSLAILLSSTIYSQISNTSSRNDAGTPTVTSGFYEASEPVNYPSGAASWWHLLDVRHHNTENNYGMQFSGSFFDQNLWFRKTNNSATTGWNKIVMEDSSGTIYLKNRENISNAGIKIQFTNLGDSWYGPYIRSVLDNASGSSSRMALKLGSYWGGEKNELTLINDNVGVGTDSPREKLDVAGSVSLSAFNYTTNRVDGKWILHTRGDGPNLFLAPRNTDDSGWNWGKQTVFKDGNISVNGKIEALEIKVTQTPTADFVFADNYDLLKLEDVEKHIREKKHLPEIASAKEMEKEGVNVGEFQIKLLQKIEELTLYVIDQNKKINSQNEQIKLQALEIEKLKTTKNNNK